MKFSFSDFVLGLILSIILFYFIPAKSPLDLTLETYEDDIIFLSSILPFVCDNEDVAISLLSVTEEMWVSGIKGNKSISDSGIVSQDIQGWMFLDTMLNISNTFLYDLAHAIEHSEPQNVFHKKIKVIVPPMLTYFDTIQKGIRSDHGSLFEWYTNEDYEKEKKYARFINDSVRIQQFFDETVILKKDFNKYTEDKETGFLGFLSSIGKLALVLKYQILINLGIKETNVNQEITKMYLKALESNNFKKAINNSEDNCFSETINKMKNIVW